MDSVLRKAIASYKRDVGTKRRIGVMKQREGKLPYNLNGYRALCSFFFQMRPIGNRYPWAESLFGGLFTKLSVNTIGRSDNIDDIMLTNIDWENDALTLLFGTSKADQTGERTSDRKRIFANPYLPELCVILQLAVFTWCKYRGPGALHLFDGNSQNKRYYQILQEALKQIPESVDFGCDRSDIGTHSNRKFAESTSVSRIDGPSRTQVCLRAGQGVGRTQDCYMFSEEDGDALVGRTVAQLKFDADEFDILPPHFGKETLKYLQEYGWNNILPGYDNYPTSYKRVLPFLLASLVYHRWKGDLDRLLPPAHPLFRTPLFVNVDLMTSLETKVILVHSHCSDTLINATGVPGIIVVSREVRLFREHYNRTCAIFDSSLQALYGRLDERMTALPQAIVDLLTERFRIDGVVPLTAADIHKLIRDVLEGPNSTMMARLDNLAQTQAQLLARMESGGTSSSVPHPAATENRRPASLFSWGGGYHRVPAGFVFPSYGIAQMMGLWFFGEPSKGIGMYKNIQPSSDLQTHKCRVNFSRTKKVLNRIIEICVAQNKICSWREVTVDNYSSLVDAAFPTLVAEAYGDKVPPRGHDKNINTFGNLLGKK